VRVLEDHARTSRRAGSRRRERIRSPQRCSSGERRGRHRQERCPESSRRSMFLRLIQAPERDDPRTLIAHTPKPTATGHWSAWSRGCKHRRPPSQELRDRPHPGAGDMDVASKNVLMRRCSTSLSSWAASSLVGVGGSALAAACHDRLQQGRDPRVFAFALPRRVIVSVRQYIDKDAESGHEIEGRMRSSCARTPISGVRVRRRPLGADPRQPPARPLRGERGSRVCSAQVEGTVGTEHPGKAPALVSEGRIVGGLTIAAATPSRWRG